MTAACQGRVLIMDDCTDERQALAARLRAELYDVTEVEAGTKGLECASGADYDVVIVDMLLGDISSSDILEQLRARRPPPAVIVLSDAEGQGARLQALYGGASDYLRRPIDLDDLVVRVAVALRQRRRLADAVREATRDALTGLGNRGEYERRLREELARAERYHRELTLVVADADGLKAINDCHGHPAGDEYLRLIAGLLAENCRATDSVFRIGGDEFAMLLPEAGRVQVSALVSRLQSEMSRRRLGRAAGAHRLSASFGTASYPVDARNAEDLCAVADAALRQAKATAAAAPRRRGSGVSRPRVLVVEDDEDLAQIIAARLEHEDLQVQLVTTRAQALAALHEERPQLLILDRCLPDGDGIDLIEEIRESPALGGLPVLVLSGLGTPHHALEGFREGANAYLAKPYEPDRLRAAIEMLLKESI